MAASADAAASFMGEDSRVARWAGTFGIAGFAVGYVTLIAQGLLVLWFAIPGVSMFNIGRRRKATPALDR